MRGNPFAHISLGTTMVSRVSRNAARDQRREAKARQKEAERMTHTGRIVQAVADLRKFYVVVSEARDGCTRISVQRVRAYAHAGAGRPGKLPPLRLAREVLKTFRLRDLYSKWVVRTGSRVARWFSAR